jgi:FixJ family two-component response regulator
VARYFVFVMESCQRTSATERLLISVVDDDVSVRESLPDLVTEFGYVARAFSSAEEFLSSDCVDQTRCLILDVFMPGMTGADLQRELKLRQQRIPIVFMTAKKK